MTDTYLPAFIEGITVGHASGIMCAYNAITYGHAALNANVFGLASGSANVLPKGESAVLG
jgi:hypothetical protein